MWAVGGRAWILRLDNSHLLELDSHRARGHGELVREPAHHVLDAHAIAGKTEPAPPHLGKRHQQLRRERAGLPLVEVAARLEEADCWLAGLRAVHEPMPHEDMAELL